MRTELEQHLAANLTCHMFDKKLRKPYLDKALDELGYTLEDLIKHLESMFQPGMSWDNYGRSGWHIHHIKPRALFEYQSIYDPQFKECWALVNLMPVWACEHVHQSKVWDGMSLIKLCKRRRARLAPKKDMFAESWSHTMNRHTSVKRKFVTREDIRQP